MLVSKIKEEDLTPEVIDKLLFQGLEDTGESIDCIIVLGSMKAAKYRVPLAVDAYQAGRAGKIMVCGGKVRDFPDGKYYPTLDSVKIGRQRRATKRKLKKAGKRRLERRKAHKGKLIPLIIKLECLLIKERVK